MSRPVIRVLRHMARSGGTVISKCLGSMTGVALLSEIHPNGQDQFNPLAQAVEWHGLVTMGEVQHWQRTRKGMGFADAMVEINKRARERGLSLVVREWSHLDVIGHPFCAPTGRFMLGEALAPRLEVAQAFTVRHPMDQYLSLVRLQGMDGLSVGAYLRGCRLFAQWAQEHAFVRYEDFTRDPDAALTTICERLRLDFDSGYRERWAAYDKITGDVVRTHGGRGIEDVEIREMPRREAPAELLAEFRACPDYAPTLELLGYDDA
ncbi:MAG: hypothetical protein DHS20C14_07810 [Phycisphaeraceae bacterium]|nr:MAG: hypothetical protein DHS20C14_07810 [Phycisphaeraceae bacterium]